jgi:predicted RecB family nuclease
MSIVPELFTSCTAGVLTGELTAQNVSLYHRSPFSIYCDKFVSPERKDPHGPYRELLFERGIEHETHVLAARYPGHQPIAYRDAREGFLRLLEEMARGAEVICGLPLLYLVENLQGRIDVIERRQGKNSRFGTYHYVVKEIKLAAHIEENHILQAAFYTYLLSRIQGCLPDCFYVINRDLEEKEYRYGDYEKRLQEAISGTVHILEGSERPTPTYNGAPWPWMTHTNHMALRLRDISLVPQVGPRMKEKLAARGLRKVWDLSSATPERLWGIPGLGRATAERLIVNARAIQKREIILLDRSALQFRNNPRELYLDLEGTDPSGEEESLEQVDYLIGLVVSEAGNVQYRPFIAWRIDEEGQMFREFVAFVTSLGETVIYHWHNYERWHLKQLADRHGFNDVVEKEIIPRMVDLHRVATRAFAFPTPTNGLKDIAKYLGFRWRHDDVNALDAIAWYLRFQKDPDSWMENLRAVVDYNEDDCMATKFVKDWLVARSGSENRSA